MDHNGFRDFVNRHAWTFAKTYAAFCPHEYLVKKRLPPEEQALFPEAARLIREEESPWHPTRSLRKRKSGS